ncbi:Swarming motility regulation sensor protein RssA [Usitatibacter rugosus]|uniref:histidine kinase n=2 Tax=Usitatibacter rugosus TaxID=2732067 RepID=A0A6M4GQE6_9PROT|nr:Swarming motility regulation sensor protein RssA [Usitatibacter rugosus]
MVVVLALAAAGSYQLLHEHQTASFDEDLADVATATVIHVGLQDGTPALLAPTQSETILRSDAETRMYFALFGSDGRLIAGDPALRVPPAHVNPGPHFWYANVAGKTVRATSRQVSVGGGPVTLAVAETMSKRERAQLEALLSVIAPTMLLCVLAAVMVLYGVKRGLAPLEHLREEIQARSYQDLSPISDADVAEELKPVLRELNNMLGRLGEAQRTQVRFVANAAHQLRTPIAGLLAQLDLVRAGTEVERAAHLGQARSSAERLARLAQQLLSLASADPASNPEVEQRACDLSDIVRDRADSWLRATTQRGVEVEFDLDVAPIRGNPMLLGELATNLVDNASRYGARNVRIATRHWGRSSLLEVTDDGPGIPEAERGRIFERFYRLDNESTEGSGLGLAIVREIAQRHGASVELSERPGESGTRVGVMFPALAP